MVILYGDPAKEGQFVYRMKFPAGYKIAPHTHANDENVTVLSGSIHIGMGDQLDPNKGETVPAGGYLQEARGNTRCGLKPLANSDTARYHNTLKSLNSFRARLSDPRRLSEEA